MDPLVLVMVFALNAAPANREAIDIDAPQKAAMVELDSQYMNAQVLSAMSMPYKYGVTQMPCKARDWQPERGWAPVREPSGRIQWVPGPVAKVFWSGIYGTCLIQSPVLREEAGEVERTALECECNGWKPAR
ncbi:MAG: hypothetical protein ABI789_15375 [Usitatibacter sp.]